MPTESPLRPAKPPFAFGQALSLLAVLAVVWLLWHTWLVFPLKMLVVFFHELSHGLAAILTGGQIAGIELLAQEGGLCRTLGGSRFLILSAGYLGSLVWGGLIVLAAARSRLDRGVMLGLGVVLTFAALAWVRPLLSFGFAFALATGLGLLLCGLVLPERVNDYLLKAIGLTSVFYAVLDIKDDILARPHLRESDAAVLAEMTGIPTLVWGLGWMVVALAAGAYFLTVAARPEPTSQGK